MKIIKVTANQSELTVGIDPRQECVVTRAFLDEMKVALRNGDLKKVEFYIDSELDGMIAPLE